MGSRKYESPKNLYAQMNVTSWIEVHSSKDFQFTETLVNAADSYILDFKPLENIMGEFTVYSYTNTRTWVFKEYSARYETAGEDLFAIICTTKDSANKNGVKPENYLIENDDGTVIYFEAREKGAKAMTGMAMLVLQAVAAHEIWDGASYKTEDINKRISDMEDLI